MALGLWTLGYIRDATRRYAKLKDSVAFTDANLDRAINQFYMLRFVLDVKPMELQDTWTFSTVAATDTETIDDDTIVSIKDYGTVDGYDLKIFFDYKVWQEIWTPTATVANNRPYQALFYGGDLIMRPTPDAVYSVIIPAWVRPLELVNVDDTPSREEWGEAIACGTARNLAGQFGDEKRYAFLTGIYEDQIAKIQGKALEQHAVKRITPRW